MKCPECQCQHKVKDGLRCSCGYQFTFSPKDARTRGFTDGKFTAAIRRASQNGTAVFTDNQLYAAYTSHAKVHRWPVFFMAAVVAALSVYFSDGDMLISSLGILVAMGLAIYGVLMKADVLSRDQFANCIERWKLQKSIDGLLEQPSLQTPPEEWPEQDIYDYGVERILIVQRDILVDLCIRNNLHIDQRMLVIAESGYPNYLCQRVNDLLQERADLPVFLLHDADASGETMERRVRSLSWLKLSDHPLVDLGFFPSDFERLKRTSNYQSGNARRAMPADALLLGSLSTGLAACLVTQSTFGDQLLKEKQNAANDGSSFG